MAGHALFMFQLGFRHVDVHNQPLFSRQRRQSSDRFLIGRILSVNAGIHNDSSAGIAVVQAYRFSGLFNRRQLIKRNTGRVYYRARDVGFRAAILHSSDHIRYKVIHIRRGYDAKPQRLRHAQQSSPVHRVSIQFVLERKDPRIEPVLQNEILAVSPHKSHRRMGVGVVKSRHQQPAAAVVFLAEILVRPGLSNVFDLVVFHAYIHILFNIEIFI